MQVLFLCSVPNVSTFGTNKAIIKDFPVFLVIFALKSKSVYYLVLIYMNLMTNVGLTLMRII